MRWSIDYIADIANYKMTNLSQVAYFGEASYLLKVNQRETSAKQQQQKTYLVALRLD
jgi:hypothetical protein